MTLNEEFDQEVRSVIQEIRKEAFYKSENIKTEGIVTIPYASETKQKIIYKLERLGAIKIMNKRYGKFAFIEMGFLLYILQPKFDEIYEKSQEKTKKQQAKETVLYLNQNGDLYREPKDKFCYPMNEKSNRHKIIRFLATNKGYQLTEFISRELGIKSEKNIRTEIGKMRNNIEKHLKIKGKDFLQSKKESGYRINPKYKITFKNE